MRKQFQYVEECAQFVHKFVKKVIINDKCQIKRDKYKAIAQVALIEKPSFSTSLKVRGLVFTDRSVAVTNITVVGIHFHRPVVHSCTALKLILLFQSMHSLLTFWLAGSPSAQ